MSMMEYKGYAGTVEYSDKDECLFGQLAYIRDLVNYEAQSAKELKAAFQKAVDDYLLSCKKRDKEPNRPFKGSFNVRTGPELHRAAVIAADGRSLNSYVCEAIREKVERPGSGV
jgi:predicted HicB family RNase H-like nuclease